MAKLTSRDADKFAMLDEATASTRRFLSTVEILDDGELGGDTLLPEWTRGHLLTHMARAGDSLCRLLEWARTGIEHAQYPSTAARAAEIEAGAGRSPGELLVDVRDSAARFDDAVRTLPPQAWSTPVRPRTGEWCTAERVVFMRLRELEIHHVDLATGYVWADVPESAGRWIIDDILHTFAQRARRRRCDSPRLTRGWSASSALAVRWSAATRPSCSPGSAGAPAVLA